MKIRMLILALAIIGCQGISVAQSQATKDNTKRPCYVDKNNNKVCDRFESKTCKIGSGTGAKDCAKKNHVAAKPTPTNTAQKTKEKK